MHTAGGALVRLRLRPGQLVQCIVQFWLGCTTMPPSRASTPLPDTRKRPAASTPTVTVGPGYERRSERRVSKAVRPSRAAAVEASSSVGGRAPLPSRVRAKLTGMVSSSYSERSAILFQPLSFGTFRGPTGGPG